jgi:uncharacterized membrane protein YdjX (TVP38/TMEM64 family)
MRTGEPGVTRGPLLALVIGLVVAALIAARLAGLQDLVRLENLGRFKAWIDGHPVVAPLAFIAGYVLAAVLFVPGLPLTVLGGVAFGPIWGTVYASIASTLGATAAFMIGRYAARGVVERWVEQSQRLAKMDRAVARHGWRIVMMTRLVPVFPFNLQNYAYGLTRIDVWTYAVTSWLCMLPATVAFTFAGGALSDGGDMRRTLAYLGAAGVLLVGISLLPRWLVRKDPIAKELL